MFTFTHRWSLGVTAYELRSGHRPFDISSKDSSVDTLQRFKTRPPRYSQKWSPEFTTFIQGLLEINPEKRTSSLEV